MAVDWISCLSLRFCCFVYYVWMVFKYTCQLNAWDDFWVQRQCSTWEAASTRCFANPANGPSLGFGIDHFPLLCDSITKTLSASLATQLPIAISPQHPQLRMHFCSFGPNDIQRYEHAAHAVDLFAFAGPADTTKCIHGAYAKTSFKGFQRFVAMSSKETITWNPSSFTPPQFSVSLCMECRKLQMPTNCKPRLV